jgi:hypothetical protein
MRKYALDRKAALRFGNSRSFIRDSLNLELSLYVDRRAILKLTSLASRVAGNQRVLFREGAAQRSFYECESARNKCYGKGALDCRSGGEAGGSGTFRRMTGSGEPQHFGHANLILGQDQALLRRG